MRILELLILFLLTVSVASNLVNASKCHRLFRLLPGFAVILVLLHVFVEGYRWQMLPVYLYALVLFLATARNLRYVGRPGQQPKIAGRKWLGPAGWIASILLLVVAALPSALVPVFRLPDPSGPYPLGIHDDYFVDSDHPETRTSGPNDYQGLSVQIWYPADTAGHAQPTRYWENAAQRSKIISRFWGGLPPFLFSHFSLVRTHTTLNAPVSKAEREFPVLIFNHGALGLPSLHTALMEDLASHGYIAVSIGHPDYIPFFALPNGQTRAFDPSSEEIQSKMKENANPEVKEIFSRLTESNDPVEQRSLYAQFLEKHPRNQASVRRWAANISFAISQLARMNEGEGPFSQRMNLDQLGVLGVSFGGAAAVQACLNDGRLKAAINIDGPQFGDVLDHGLARPTMFMDSEQLKHKNALFLSAGDNPTHCVLIHNTTHQNFSDIGYWGLLFKKQMLGRIDPFRCQQIQNAYVVAFFDRYLRGIETTLLDGPSPDYPEVDLIAGTRAASVR